jgi:flagellar protein FliS
MEGQMYVNTAYDQYQAQAVETASPAKLVLMLFDGALSSITRAEQAMTGQADTSWRETANAELQRAQRIVEELLVSLDVERGGEVAANLAALYDFCLDRLTTANFAKDASQLPAVRDTLAGLREAWEQACCLQAVSA